MLSLVERGELVGYGWLQRWASVRHEFWWLADDGICLGPYWTHPEHRGRGVYGRMLRHSLHVAWTRFPGTPLYIWARAENAPSIRGIQATGFRALGLHAVSLYACGFVRRHRQVGAPV